MTAYILRRLLLIPFTLLGIVTTNFFIVQLAPGGPIEQLMAELRGPVADMGSRITGTAGAETQTDTRDIGSNPLYRGAQGIDAQLRADLARQFGFDKPLWIRFGEMVRQYAVFDLGRSFFRDRPVVDLVIEKLPVSVSLGLWSTLIIYVISIPLGIVKAVHHGSAFDRGSSLVVIVGNAIPSFLFAILLIVIFAGGRYLDWFPLRGFTSDNWADLSWPQRILDYLWHITLPTAAMVIGGFATLTLLVKNSFLDEIRKQYVTTARAKGLTEPAILYGHVFRNALLIVIAGFPAALVSLLFTGSLLIEVIFSLDGIGLLAFEAITRRDYPVMFGTLYAFSLLGLLLNLMTDISYHLIDPRINFEAKS